MLRFSYLLSTSTFNDLIELLNRNPQICLFRQMGLDDLVSAYVASAVIVCALNMMASLFLSYHSARGIIWDPHEKTTR